MMTGYARVSTEKQNLDLQKDALKDAGCESVFVDKVSGASIKRPGLAKALRSANAGDVLTGQGAMLDTTRAEERMIFGIFAALAEFERELISGTDKSRYSGRS